MATRGGGRFLPVLGLLALAATLPPAHAADGLAAQPLAPRSRPAGPTLFTTLDPAATGVVAPNAYADPRMWGERYQEFTVGAIGTGVAVADYDGDGRPDLFVVSKTEGGRLFRNLGDWRFADVTARAGLVQPAGVWSQGAAFADINNDGRPDLYICRFGAPNLLFVNRGDGTFAEEAAARGLALDDASGGAAFADYDRDGWLDVFVQTNLRDAAREPTGRPDRLYRNRGDGTFADVTAAAGLRPGPTQGHSATWWDHDGDGWPDLYVANDFAAPDTLHRNNRDGTFTDVSAAAVPVMPYSAMGADLGDVDNDGRIDLLVADMAATTPEKDQRGMADARARNRDDPRPDAPPPQLQRNALYLATGTPRVREAALLAGLAATDWTWAVRWEDFDNDGRLDLFVTNGMVRELHNTDLLARMMAAESPAERGRIMRDSPVLAEPNLAFRNLGDLRFAEVGAAWGLDRRGVSFGAATGDFDGDGDLDLVFTNYQDGPTVLRNDAPDGHRLIVALRGTASNRFGVGATVRVETAEGAQVRQLVLARGYLSTSEPVLHFGLGAAARVARLTVAWPSGRWQEFTDLAADQRWTITEPAGATPPAPVPVVRPLFAPAAPALGLTVAAREDVVDETARQRLVPVRLHRRGPAVAAGDLNGDGRDELVVGGTTAAPATTLWAAGPGAAPGFRAERGPGGGPAALVSDGPVLIFDADGDGRNDAFVAMGGATLPEGAVEYRPRLWLGTGTGWRLAPVEVLPALTMSVGAAVAADFDRDGRLEVFLGGRVRPGEYPWPARSALLAQRGGRWEEVTERWAPALRAPGLVTAALASDADGDGWVDLLVATEWGAVRYFHNAAGAGFVERTEEAGFAAAGHGWWTALASADFNGDGRPDYVAGNAGENTGERPDAAHPVVLLHGRFGAGPPEALATRWAGDRLVPARARRELSARWRMLGRRWPTNDGFARAGLEELFDAGAVAAARRFEATELRSGVFLSTADGRWEFAPWPRSAQLAPAQGLAAGDFDGDGHADLVVAQNSYAPVPATGPWAGGLGQVLRGDGRGGFAAVAPVESGWIVPGDAKGLAVLDWNADGWPDVLVTRNQATTLAWENLGVAGRTMWQVRLRGAAGNLAGIGARVTVEWTDGRRRVAEMFAGSGYYGQSAAAVFVGFATGDAPARVRVRWPGGKVSEHPLAAGAEGVVEVAEPR